MKKKGTLRQEFPSTAERSDVGIDDRRLGLGNGIIRKHHAAALSRVIWRFWLALDGWTGTRRLWWSRR